MTTQPEVIRQSDLLNQMVLNRDTMEELGRIEVLWMYPQAHRVLGFICKSGFLGTKKFAFQLAQLEAIGSNGILTHSAPEPTTADKVSQLESLLQHEIWTDKGDRIGKITDCLFHLPTGTITQYLFVSNGLTGILGDVYQLPPGQILSFGQKRVLVSEASGSRFALYREGIPQKITEVSEFIKEEATQEWRSLTRKAEAVTEKTKERLQDLTSQTKERTQQISEEAKEQVKNLNDQLQGETTSWVERLRGKGQTVAKQLKQQTRKLSRQVEEGIETIVVQAEEIFDPEPEEPEFDADFDFETDSETEPTKRRADTKTSPPSQKVTNPDLEEDDDEPWI